MPMKRDLVQFRKGLCLNELLERCGDGDKCHVVPRTPPMPEKFLKHDL